MEMMGFKNRIEGTFSKDFFFFFSFFFYSPSPNTPPFHRRGFSERRTLRSYPTQFPSFALRATERVINRVFRSFSVGYHSYPTQFPSFALRATEWVINRVFRSFSVGYHSYPTQFRRIATE